MIYLDKKNKKLRIPRHQGTGEGSYRRHEVSTTPCYTVKITNNITGDLIMTKYLENKSNSVHTYVFEGLDWKAFKDSGEYLYEVIDHNRVIETGLITYGNYKREHKSFESETKIIQYDPNK